MQVTKVFNRPVRRKVIEHGEFDEFGNPYDWKFEALKDHTGATLPVDTVYKGESYFGGYTVQELRKLKKQLLLSLPAHSGPLEAVSYSIAGMNVNELSAERAVRDEIKSLIDYYTTETEIKWLNYRESPPQIGDWLCLVRKSPHDDVFTCDLEFCRWVEEFEAVHTEDGEPLYDEDGEPLMRKVFGWNRSGVVAYTPEQPLYVGAKEPWMLENYKLPWNPSLRKPAGMTGLKAKELLADYLDRENQLHPANKITDFEVLKREDERDPALRVSGELTLEELEALVFHIKNNRIISHMKK